MAGVDRDRTYRGKKSHNADGLQLLVLGRGNKIMTFFEKKILKVIIKRNNYSARSAI